MNRTYCNPLDFGYRYQHILENGNFSCNREGADPTLILFKGRYYMFVSVSAGFWYSDDLLNWQFHANQDLLIYHYAPDVRQIGEYLYFSASGRDPNGPILRTQDPLGDDFEEVTTTFPFWDPNIFCDDDGRVYFYWGCSNVTPIYGVEMDPKTMMPLGEKVALIEGHEAELGYERVGDNGISPDPENFFKPFIEGPFMTKYEGKYYLQYAAPGTQFNTYCDGVYVSDAPLGPFTLQVSNPFSAKTGGFITGAGHGSTIADRHGNYWHTATMRISMSHPFERRVGLFPAGFDQDGILYCNQNFGDYPFRIPEGKFDAAALKPEWMLLSYGKPVEASSTEQGSDPAWAVDEDIRTWWSAGSPEPGQWLTVDLEKVCDVRAIQVNLADAEVPMQFGRDNGGRSRVIDLTPQISHYTLEVSADGEHWSLLDEVARECSNGYFEYSDGFSARYIRLTGGALPYHQRLRVSGLRIFGNGGGEKPPRAEVKAKRTGDLDAVISWKPIEGAQGCNVRYGIAPDKLYLSHLVYGSDQVRLSTLMKGQKYYFRVDSFNENGITEGNVIATDD